MLAPLVGTILIILRTKVFWTLLFATFLGSTITFINFRIGAHLSNLALSGASSESFFSPSLLNSLALLATLPLVLGLRKMHRLRKEAAIAKLLAQDEDEGSPPEQSNPETQG